MRDLKKLRMLAEHLMSEHLTEKYKKLSFLDFENGNILVFHNNTAYLRLLPWFEEELDVVHPADFTRNRKGHVRHLGFPKANVIYLLPSYYNISSEEFMQLFIHNKIHRTRQKDGKSQIQAIHVKICADIIMEFVESEEIKGLAEEQTLVRTVLIEKKHSYESMLLKMMRKNER